MLHLQSETCYSPGTLPIVGYKGELVCKHSWKKPNTNGTRKNTLTQLCICFLSHLCTAFFMIVLPIFNWYTMAPRSGYDALLDWELYTWTWSLTHSFCWLGLHYHISVMTQVYIFVHVKPKCTIQGAIPQMCLGKNVHYINKSGIPCDRYCGTQLGAFTYFSFFTTESRECKVNT